MEAIYDPLFALYVALTNLKILINPFRIGGRDNYHLFKQTVWTVGDKIGLRWKETKRRIVEDANSVLTCSFDKWTNRTMNTRN